MAEVSASSSELIAREASILALCEWGLGSLLHTFHVPLAGHFLSLNQSFLLSRLLREAPSGGARSAPLKASVAAALLKSLAPVGKKLTPMLAISAQGALFSLGALPGGLWGVIFGSALASVWAFAQPILLASFIFGQEWWLALKFTWQKLQQAWPWLQGEFLWEFLAALILLKMLLAMALAWLAWRLPAVRYQRWLAFLARLSRANKRPLAKHAVSWQAAARGAWRDLFQPFLVLSLLMIAVFFIWAEAPAAQLIWALLRPIAVGYLLFFLIRLLPLEPWLAQPATQGSFRGALQRALELIRS